MKILVSACLLGENCKYSGGNNYNQAVCDFARGHQVVPVCPELAILQSRSPSCGVKEIYDGTFSGTKIPGQGVFAKMLMDEGIRVLDAGELPKIILKNEDGKCQSN